MAMSKQEKTDAVMSALGHPVRRKILQKLANNTNGGMSPKRLADDLGEPLGNVAYHIRVLSETTAVKLAKEIRRRGAIEHVYKRAGNSIDKRVTEVLDLIGKD